ncbi:MAG TPA: cobalamin-binding protein [Nitrospiraceae bacterium]|nr:cobalamin-binding protein [Nitrospiraceae bacterium]
MRICSLVPGATEAVAALGLADQLVGISHECDFPSSARHAPVMIEPVVGKGLTRSAEIDREVKEMVGKGARLYRLNEQAFRLAQPDLILTQDLCDVCAITPDQLSRAVELLPHKPRIVTLSPTTVEDTLLDVERIAEAVCQPAKGQELAGSLRRRLDLVCSRTTNMTSRPRVVCLEWLDPLYVAGHWVPEMVGLAGGHEVLGHTDAPSRETTWEEVEAAQPEIVLVMPCGYSIDRTIQELSQAGQTQNQWRRAHDRLPQTYIVDAASYFSRPGPRLVDGVELLASLLHPEPNHPFDRTRAIKLESALLALDTTS